MKRGIALGIVISAVMVSLFAVCAKPATAPAPAETPEELLDRVSGIASITYDLVVTYPEKPEESVQFKAWVKGSKMRSEFTDEGQTLVIITDKEAQVGYMYDPSQNVATKGHLRGEMGLFMGLYLPSATEWAKLILASSKLVVVGSETVDGKACLVVETTGDEGKAKTWFWKEYGLPIRTESLDGLIEWKNIEIGYLPDSMFELPSGVKIQEQ